MIKKFADIVHEWSLHLAYTGKRSVNEDELAEVMAEEAALKAKGLRRLITVRPGTEVSAEAPDEEDQSIWHQAWDDLTGQELLPEKVAEARATELAHVHHKKVWSRMPRAEPFGAGSKSSTRSGSTLTRATR